MLYLSNEDWLGFALKLLTIPFSLSISIVVSSAFWDSYYILHVSEFFSRWYQQLSPYFQPPLRFLFIPCILISGHICSHSLTFFCLYVLYLIFDFKICSSQKPVKWTLLRSAAVCLVQWSWQAFWPLHSLCLLS